jgi:hypothetical protein
MPKPYPSAAVLMDSWYATQKLMAQIDYLGKRDYCPLKRNRRVDDSGGTQSYQRVDELTWDAGDLGPWQAHQDSRVSQRQVR